MKLYKASELREAVGISKVTYDQWKARRFLNFAYVPGGTGHPQRHTLKEVFQTAVLARLVALDVPVSKAVKRTRWLSLGGKEYLIYPSGHGKTVSAGELRAELRKGEALTIVSLRKIEKRVRWALPV